MLCTCLLFLLSTSSLMLIFMHVYNALLLQCGHHQSPLLQVGTDPGWEPYFKKFKYLSSVVSEHLEEQRLSATPTDSPQEEQFQLYLSDMKVPQEEIDAIDFWVANKARFPSCIRHSRYPHIEYHHRASIFHHWAGKTLSLDRVLNGLRGKFSSKRTNASCNCFFNYHSSWNCNYNTNTITELWY